MTIRWGVLSTARINRPILEGARASDRIAFVAVASRDEARAVAYARENGIERAYGSYEALLEDTEVEAVYISLPNSLHMEWTMHALAFSFQLATVHGADDARFRPELDGGSLMDVGCYCLSSIRFLAGEPERVYAEHVRGESGVDVRFAATLRFRGDVVARFDCGFVVPYRDELEVVGDMASLFVTIRGTSTRPASTFGGRPDPRRSRSSGSRSSRQTPTGSSSRMSATRSAARRPCCSGATMLSVRRARSRRPTGRPRRAIRSSSSSRRMFPSP